MNAKAIATVLLLAFVGASLIYVVVQEATPDGTQQAGVAESGPGARDASAMTASRPSEATGHKLIAYYFHRTKRCRTCLTIQRYAEEVLKEAFPEAIRTGELEWRLVNVEERANEHFVTDYQLTSSELVFVDTEDGQQTEWRNLKRIWDLVGNEFEFKAYVEAEAMIYLEPGS